MNDSNNNAPRQVKNFTLVDNTIIDAVNLAPHELAVYIVILRHDYHDRTTKRRKNFSYPSIRTIRKKTGMSNRKIYEALNVLASAGMIEISNQNRTKKDGTQSKLTRNYYGIKQLNFENEETRDRINAELVTQRKQIRFLRGNINVTHGETYCVTHGETEKDKSKKTNLKRLNMNGASHSRRTVHPILRKAKTLIPESDSTTLPVLAYFLKRYSEEMGETHPPYSVELLKNCVISLGEYEVTAEFIDKYFKTNFSKFVDYRLAHFCTAGILQHRNFEIM